MFSTKSIIFITLYFSFLISLVGGQSDGDEESGYGGRGGYERFQGSRKEDVVNEKSGTQQSNIINDEAKMTFEELQEIMHNENLTKQEIEDSIRSFYEGIGGNALKHFNEKQAKMEAYQQQFNQWITSTTKLSDAAKEFLTQIAAIKANMQITKAEEQQQIKALYAGASDDVLQEAFNSQAHREFRNSGGRGRRPSSSTPLIDQNV